MKKILNTFIIMLFSLAVFSQAKDVRKVVDIRPDQFTVANEAFKPYLSQIIENISTNLKLTKRVKLKLLVMKLLP